MRIFSPIAFAAVLLVSPAANASDIDGLAARSIAAYEQIEGIRQEMREATGEMPDRKRALDQALFALEKSPFGPEELEALDKMIATEESNIARMKEAGMDESAMAYNHRRLHELGLQRSAAVITDEAERAEHRSLLEAERDGLAKKIEQIEAPFNERIGEIRSGVFPDNDALSKALGGFFHAPTDTFEGATLQPINASMEMAFAGLEWHDAEGTRVAWAHVRIRNESETPWPTPTCGCGRGTSSSPSCPTMRASRTPRPCRIRSTSSWISRRWRRFSRWWFPRSRAWTSSRTSWRTAKNDACACAGAARVHAARRARHACVVRS
jgi:hypothetical protein